MTPLVKRYLKLATEPMNTMLQYFKNLPVYMPGLGNLKALELTQQVLLSALRSQTTKLPTPDSTIFLCLLVLVM